MCRLANVCLQSWLRRICPNLLHTLGIANYAAISQLRPAWVPPEEEDGNEPHQGGVKYVERPFVRQQVPAVPHGKLDDPENTPHHNERAHGVEHVEILLPLQVRFAALLGRVPASAYVDADGREPEKAKHDNLDHEADFGDALALLCALDVSHHGTAGGLHHEGEDVAQYENRREPPRANQRKVCSVDAGDDARERHVDGGGEEGGSEENEYILDEEGDELVGILLGGGASAITNEFDCGGVSWNPGGRTMQTHKYSLL